jgi:hypothetical protein
VGALSVAIERENWELAALCLLLGVAKAAEALSAESVDALIELLAEPVPTRRAAAGHRRRDAERKRHN